VASETARKATEALAEFADLSVESGVTTYNSSLNPDLAVREGFVSKSWISDTSNILVGGVPGELYGDPPVNNFDEIFKAYLNKYPALEVQ
jgi:hypothetical protein